jgi:hypothetical protein
MNAGHSANTAFVRGDYLLSAPIPVNPQSYRLNESLPSASRPLTEIRHRASFRVFPVTQPVSWGRYSSSPRPKKIVDKINNRPCKVLGGLTSCEAFLA